MKPNGNNGTATSNNNGDACDDAGSSSNTIKQSNNNEQSHSSSEPAHSSSEAEAPATAAAAPGIGVPVVKRVNQRAQGTQKKTRLLIKAGTGFRYCPSERRSHYPYLRGRGGESSIISEPPWGSVSLSLQIDSHSSDTHGWVTGPSPPNHQSSDGAAPCSRGEPTARVASPRSPPPDSISPSLLLTPPTPANTLPSKTHSRTCANTNATSSPTSDPKVESKGLLASPISVKTHEETLKCRSLDHSPRMANAEVARANVQQQRHSPECRSVQWTAASSSSDDDDEDEEDNIMRTPASPRPRALKQDEQREPTTPPLAKTEPRTPHGRTNATAAIPTWNALQKSLEHEKWRANAQRVAVAHALAIPRLCFPPGNRLVREYRQEKIMSRVGHILGDGGAHQPTPPSRQHSIARRKGAGKIQSGLMVGGVSSAGEKAKEKGLLHQKSFGAGGFSSADVSGRRVEHGDVVGGDDVDASSSDEDGANDQCEDTENEAGGGLDLLSLWTPDTTAQGEPDVTGDQVVARRSVHWPEQSTVIESPLAHDVHSLGGGYQALPEPALVQLVWAVTRAIAPPGNDLPKVTMVRYCPPNEREQRLTGATRNDDGTATNNQIFDAVGSSDFFGGRSTFQSRDELEAMACLAEPRARFSGYMQRLETDQNPPRTERMQTAGTQGPMVAVAITDSPKATKGGWGSTSIHDAMAAARRDSKIMVGGTMPLPPTMKQTDEDHTQRIQNAGSTPRPRVARKPSTQSRIGTEQHSDGLGVVASSGMDMALEFKAKGTPMNNDDSTLCKVDAGHTPRHQSKAKNPLVAEAYAKHASLQKTASPTPAKSELIDTRLEAVMRAV